MTKLADMTEEEATKGIMAEGFLDGERVFVSGEPTKAKDESAGDDGAAASAAEQQGDSGGGSANDDEPEALTDEEVQEALDADDETDDKVRETAKKLAQKMASGRIGKLTQMKHAKDREIADLKAKLAAAGGQAAPAPVAQPTAVNQATIDARAAAIVAADPDAVKQPKADDYELGTFDEKYLADLLDYRMDQKERLTSAKKQVNAEVAKAESATTLDQSYRAKLSKVLTEGTKPADDYDKVVIEGAKKGEWPLSASMGRCIADSEHGMQVAYHLASNSDLAKEIYSLPDHQQVLRFGKIEAEFAKGGKPAVKISQAPAPIQQTRGSGATVNGKPPIDSEDFAQFEGWAKKQKIQLG